MYLLTFTFLIGFIYALQIPVNFQKVDLQLDGFVGAKIEYTPSNNRCTLLEKYPVQNMRTLNFDNQYEVYRKKLEQDKYKSVTEKEVIEINALNEKSFFQALYSVCKFGLDIEDDEFFVQNFNNFVDDEEVLKIIDSGASENRVDVVFMGDGYTSAEKSKFFDDIKRLTKDMWTGVTFRSVKPLMNVWAVFKPSVESGIGVSGKPKNTPFGLYRDGTELRGIYCSKPQQARRSCKVTGSYACDFPSLIANDDYYGGLGGEFTISTKSILSGTIVLRHELGHNFISVGEEYDGGDVYSGVNAAPTSTLNNLKWKHWLSEPNNVKEEKEVLLLQAYPWYDLAKGEIALQFKSEGVLKRWMLQISASGVESKGSLVVTLDGKELPWTPRGDFDREFYRWEGNEGFSSGSHTLIIKQGFPAVEGSPIRQLCNVEIHEFADEPLFHLNNTFVGAYPTFNSRKQKTYRPTNEACLMRNMKSTSFCPICQEGLWLNFLNRVNLIDEVKVECKDNEGVIKSRFVPLGHLRPENEQIDGEELSIKWFHNGVEELHLHNLNEFKSKNGDWEVEVKFKSLEIRKDEKNLTFDKKSFKVEC
ncbi:hypothetical protein HDU92_005153 [Lobulomyces angularis]|nr:hypothetical protein HDU92_005153 [Lobulomyces angularis]